MPFRGIQPTIDISSDNNSELLPLLLLGGNSAMAQLYMTIRQQRQIDVLASKVSEIDTKVSKVEAAAEASNNLAQQIAAAMGFTPTTPPPAS